MSEYYILREGRKIVYQGSDWDHLKKRIRPSQEGPKHRMFTLSAVRIKDKKVNITYQEVYRLAPDGEIYNLAISEVRKIPLNDLEKLIEKIKATV